MNALDHGQRPDGKLVNIVTGEVMNGDINILDALQIGKTVVKMFNDTRPWGLWKRGACCLPISTVSFIWIDAGTTDVYLKTTLQVSTSDRTSCTANIDVYSTSQTFLP